MELKIIQENQYQDTINKGFDELQKDEQTFDDGKKMTAHKAKWRLNKWGLGGGRNLKAKVDKETDDLLYYSRNYEGDIARITFEKEEPDQK